MKPAINIKRVYDKPLTKDGFRILVDRLWPRGITKEDAKIDDWAKLVAPTNELRKWFGHEPEHWVEFQKKYREELRNNEAIADFIEAHKDKKIITLIYGAKDTEHTHALVLQEYMKHAYDV